MRRGRLYILSGPSGSGKDSILRTVLRRVDHLALSVSWTTRPMRDPRETEKYRFVSAKAFERMLAEDGFLEYNRYLGQYYGTPARPVETMLAAGTDVLLEIDVNGAEKVKTKCPDAVRVFVIPPSFAVLSERLRARGTESPERRAERLELAAEEARRAAGYDYLVVNDDLETACGELASILLAGRCEMNSRSDRLKEFLSCLTLPSEN